MMVTSQINSVSFSAAAVNTVTTDRGAFLQALQQEIGTADTLSESIPAYIPDGSLLTEGADSEADAQLMQLFQFLLGIAAHGDENKNLQLPESLKKLLNNKDESDNGKEVSSDASLLEIVQQMIDLIREQLGEDKLQTLTPDETRSDTVIEDLRDAWIKISPDFSQETIPTADVFVRTDETSKPENAPKSAEKISATDGSGESVEEHEVQDAKTARVPEEAVKVKAEETLTEDAQFTVIPERTETTEKKAYLPEDGIQNESAETTEQTGTYKLHDLRTQLPQQKSDEIPGKERVIEDLIRYAKENLGLEKAGFSDEEPVTESIPTHFYPSANTVRAEDASEEFTQLLTSVIKPAEQEEGTDKNTIGFLNEKTVDFEEVKTEKPIENAVKIPEELNVVIRPTVVDNGVTITETQSQQAPVTTQISEQIIAHLQTAEDGKATFTMTLNPESLGKIEVKISSQEGRVSVEITAQSKQTQSILAERLDGLRETLKQNGVELEKYQVVYTPEETATRHQSYDGSSKNPYSRRQNNNGKRNDESDDEFEKLLASL